MHICFKAAAAVALVCAAAPAIAQQPARWHLDGATNRCVLTRRLEGTPVPATFVLRAIPGSHRYELILAGRELPADLRRDGRVMRIALSPGERSYEGAARAINLPGELDRGVVFGPFPAGFLAQLGGSSTLRLASAEGAELGSWTIPLAARAAEAFESCEAEKLVEWGADPAAVEAGATPPRPSGDARAWLTSRDLGLATANGSAAFTAVFRLVVEPDGRASGCTLMESITNIDAPGNVCRALVGRARFEPARNAQGTPVRSVAIHIVSVRTEVEFRLIGA